MVVFDLILPLKHTGNAYDVCRSLLVTNFLEKDGGDITNTIDHHSDVRPSECQTAHNILVYSIQVYRSRVLWNALRPLIFDSTATQARKALRCILTSAPLWDNCGCLHNRTNNVDDTFPNDSIPTKIVNEQNGHGVSMQTRRIKVSSISRKKNYSKSNHQQPVEATARRIVLWIHPPDSIPMEYLFTGLLIRWEHQLIQAQSVSGYIATLGGGYFLCHHFHTAIRLAKLQQQVAIILNDESMYYTCSIHQAYSHIYAGHFKAARSILQQVQQIMQPNPDQPSSYPVLTKMCHSAERFCKRMKRASRNLTSVTHTGITSPSGHQNQSTGHGSGLSSTVDDYQRIRVVRDKSNRHDLVIPFSLTSRS